MSKVELPNYSQNDQNLNIAKCNIQTARSCNYLIKVTYGGKKDFAFEILDLITSDVAVGVFIVFILICNWLILCPFLLTNRKVQKVKHRGKQLDVAPLSSDSTLNKLRGGLLINHYTLMSWIDLKRGRERTHWQWDILFIWRLYLFYSWCCLRHLKAGDEERAWSNVLLFVWITSHVSFMPGTCISSRVYFCHRAFRQQ